jgi:hypothetical protein
MATTAAAARRGKVQACNKAVENIPFESAQAQVLIGQPGIARNNPIFWPCWWATTSGRRRLYLAPDGRGA